MQGGTTLKPEGERRVTFSFEGEGGKTIKGTGTLIGQERAGGAVIPEGSHKVLSLRYGEFTILPDDPQLLTGQASPQPA